VCLVGEYETVQALQILAIKMPVSRQNGKLRNSLATLSSYSKKGHVKGLTCKWEILTLALEGRGKNEAEAITLQTKNEVEGNEIHAFNLEEICKN
jgi:hypothetical protein